MIGLTARTTNAAEASGHGHISTLWQRLFQSGALERIPNRVGGDIAVVYSDYASDQNGEYDYTVGARVSSAGKVPEGMVMRVVPAGRYAAVQSKEGMPQETVPKLWKRIWAMTPQELGGVRAFRVDFETYPPESDPGKTRMTAHLGLK